MQPRNPKKLVQSIYDQGRKGGIKRQRKNGRTIEEIEHSKLIADQERLFLQLRNQAFRKGIIN